MTHIQVNIESVQTIKPSPPALDSKKSFKLCFLDQHMPPIYVKLILFYNTKDGHEKVPLLKESLSQTLRQFYPLAGRIKDDITIECSDDEIPYIVARADCSMLEYLKVPDVKLVQDFLPIKRAPTKPINELVLVAIQVTVFTCGGLAIGGCFNHKIMDGASIGCFLKNWAANFNGCHDSVVYPDFEIASQEFPPRSSIYPGVERLFQHVDTTCRLTRYVLNHNAIEALKLKGKGMKVPNPSRVEVVSAFMWKHLIANSKYSKHTPDSTNGRTSSFMHAVNLRKRALSPNPKHSIGNLVSSTFATVVLSQGLDQELDVIVGRIHEAISTVDKDYVARLRGETAVEMMRETFKHWVGDRETLFVCSSWCNLGIDEVDFGWGRPIWISPWGEVEESYKHCMILMNVDEGKGIEVWIVLEEPEIVMLESDREFTAFAIPAKGIFMPNS